MKRYYVRREECWGGTYVWVVRDRERLTVPYRARCCGRAYRTERSAEAMCERANEDWEKFLSRESLPVAGRKAG